MKKVCLKLRNVEKQYPEFTLGPATFEIFEGETCAIVGKNGAGKTTLFQIITGNADPSDGEVYLGETRLLPDSFQLKRNIGYLPQNLDLPRWVTGQEILYYACRLYNIDDVAKKVEETLAYWDCSAFANRPLAACSHGMQKRIALSLATIHEPDFLVLDEPFSGLDLYHIRALENLILKRTKDGKATIICTHVALYAARLCQRAMVVSQGQITELSDWPTTEPLNRIALMEEQFFASNR